VTRAPGTLRPPVVDHRALRRLPTWTPGVAAILTLGGVAWVIFSRAFLNYDTLYMLVWGRDLIHGRSPDYDVTLAPTPHPLAEAAGALASLAGRDGGYTLMLALAMLSFGALVWAVFRLGEASFSWPVGLLAAAVVATREPFLSRAVRAYVDIPFLALIVTAALIEVRRPRRGWPVLALLALAGLLRPEAWLLSAAYWLYLQRALDRRGRIVTAALAAAPALVWALSDLAISGDLLHSLTGTRDVAETLHRPRGIGQVPEIMPRRLGEILRLPVLAGGSAGFLLALYLKRGMALVPAALAVLGGVAFVALGIADLPLIGRYLFLPAAMLAIFFAFAALGWLGVEPGTLRRRWALGGVVLLVAFAAYTPANVSGLDHLRDGIQLRGRIEDDLRSLARSAAGKPTLERCATVYVPNHRPVPILAWQLDRRADDFVSAALVRPSRGAFVAPANALVEQKFVLDPNDPQRVTVTVPPGFRRVTANRSWILYENGC
jgi:hypothetical protein